MASDEPLTSRPKPSVRQLGVDLASLDWQRSGAGDGSFEVAFVRERGEAASAGPGSWPAERGAAPDADDRGTSEPAPKSGQVGTIGGTTPKSGENGSRALAGTSDGATEWVLLRVAGDPSGRVLVYDTAEWRYFVDGARGGEFDAAPLGAERAEARRDSGVGAGVAPRSGSYGGQAGRPGLRRMTARGDLQA